MNRNHRQRTWGIAIGVIAIVAGLGRRHFHGAMGMVLAITAILLFGHKACGGIRSASQRVRYARGRGCTGFALIKEIIPPWLRGVAKTEALIYSEVLCALMRRDLPSNCLARQLPMGLRFTLANGPVSGVLLPLAIIGMLADLPLSFIVIAIFKPVHELAIHAVLFGMALWGLVWVAGDRSAIKRLEHVVNDDAIHLQVGFRWRMDIPLNAIQRCTLIQGKARIWLREMSIDRADVLMVTPIDTPNLLIELTSDGLDRVRIEKMGASARGRQFFAVYLDDPAGFLVRVTRFRAKLGANQTELINA